MVECGPGGEISWTPTGIPPKIIIFNIKFIIFNAKFIIFDTYFIIINENFINFNTNGQPTDFPSGEGHLQNSSF